MYKPKEIQDLEIELAKISFENKIKEKKNQEEREEFLIKSLIKLENALNKICEFNDENYVVFKEVYERGHDCSETLSANEWKEWALEDV